jgi:hypothetical protein
MQMHRTGAVLCAAWVMTKKQPVPGAAAVATGQWTIHVSTESLTCIDQSAVVSC